MVIERERRDGAREEPQEGTYVYSDTCITHTGKLASKTGYSAKKTLEHKTVGRHA